MNSEIPMRLAGEGGKSMSRRVALNATIVKAAVVPEGKSRVYVYDLKVRQLALQVMASGAKAFYLVKRRGNGLQNRFKLGDWPDISVEQARDLAFKKLGEIANGVDPMEARMEARRQRTLGQVFEDWKTYAQERLRARTVETDQSRFETCLGDWKHWPVKTITRADVKVKHAAIGSKHGHVSANRAVQVLRKLLNFAGISPNPAVRGTGEDRLSLFRETPRVRSLNSEELSKLFTALDQHDDQAMADFFRLALWTGARRGNVSSMAWSEVSLGGCTWTIPPEKTKAHNPIVVHLAAPAMKILQARYANRKADSPWVFPGRGATGHLVEVKMAWKALLEAAGLQNVHVHDLRHTLASWMVNEGADLQVVQRTLGHENIQTTQRYAHLSMDRVREGVETVVASMMKAGSKREEKADETAVNAAE